MVGSGPDQRLAPNAGSDRKIGGPGSPFRGTFWLTSCATLIGSYPHLLRHDRRAAVQQAPTDLPIKSIRVTIIDQEGLQMGILG
jgi:hypothetical protein